MVSVYCVIIQSILNYVRSWVPICLCLYWSSRVGSDRLMNASVTQQMAMASIWLQALFRLCKIILFTRIPRKGKDSMTSLSDIRAQPSSDLLMLAAYYLSILQASK